MKLSNEQLLQIGDTIFESDLPKKSGIFVFTYTQDEGVTPCYKLNNLELEQLFTLVTVARKTLDDVEQAYYNKLKEGFVEREEDGDEPS
jgi:hypothetical protein